MQWEDLYRAGGNGSVAPFPAVWVVIALLGSHWRREGISLFDFLILHIGSGRVRFPCISFLIVTYFSLLLSGLGMFDF